MDQVADIKLAIARLRELSAFLSIDPDRVVVVGKSAGGHLAALTALSPGEWEPTGVSATTVDGFVDIVGPTDFATWGRTGSTIDDLGLVRLGRIVSGCVGADIGNAGSTSLPDPSPDCLAKMSTASPFSWASADAPPAYLICGANDGLVPCNQHTLLRDALRSAHGGQQLAAVYDRYDDDPDNPPERPPQRGRRPQLHVAEVLARPSNHLKQGVSP